MKLSIVIPVYNEESTILEILKTVKGVSLPTAINEREIILVDDCSRDGTRAIIKKIKDPGVKIFYHPKNMGKGGALNTGFKKTTGEIIIIQDADMEYDPNEYPKLLSPIIEGKADVVYGSRYKSVDKNRVPFFWHTTMNKFLTLLSNMFSDLNLTDMETCYKVFKKEVLSTIDIQENRFGFEPEITAKIAELTRTKGVRVYETGISYVGRGFEEGKKIGWKDGVWALWCIFKYNTSSFARFFKYGVNGLLVAFSQIATMVILVRYLGLDTIKTQAVANLISIEVSVLVGFVLHSFLTWRRKYRSSGSFLKAFLAFHLVTGASIIVRAILFPLLATTGINYVLNSLIGIVVALFMNFVGYDKLVFKKKKGE